MYRPFSKVHFLGHMRDMPEQSAHDGTPCPSECVWLLYTGPYLVSSLFFFGNMLCSYHEAVADGGVPRTEKPSQHAEKPRNSLNDRII